MTEKSPYIEAGLTAREEMWPGRVLKEAPQRSGFSGQNDPELLKTGHDWGVVYAYNDVEASRIIDAQTIYCRNCGKAKFAVEAEVCRAAKKAANARKVQEAKMEEQQAQDGEERTLAQFVKVMGSKEAAAGAAGVSLATYTRWLRRQCRPQGNNARRLRELKITW